jgi:hypothetical protein
VGSSVTWNTQPLNFQRVAVVGMVCLHSCLAIACLTLRRSNYLARFDGILHHLTSAYLSPVSFTSKLAVFTHTFRMRAFPPEYAKPVSLPIILAPFIAALFGAFRVVDHPLSSLGLCAWLTAWRTAERMASAQVEMLKRFRLFACRAPLHGITILSRNHYSLAHGGRQ